MPVLSPTRIPPSPPLTITITTTRSTTTATTTNSNNSNSNNSNSNNNNNNNNNRSYLKITQKIPEQHNGKARNQGNTKTAMLGTAHSVYCRKY